MPNLKIVNYLQILLILSIIILTSAFVIEYGFGFRPCNLCIIERIPYAIAIVILFLNYIFKENQVFFSILLILVFSFSVLISVYHFSIEQGFIDESAICKSENLNLITKEDILKSLKEFRINCKDVAFKIFGFSLTTYNIFISILMFLLSTKVYLVSNDIKK
ncbi:disulfide bond formation protein B [Pelagibacterales bacterium SAG-MED43]|nr:disulfide bond formation protein B [Pelagibacterales bacterium SAG-MED43]